MILTLKVLLRIFTFVQKRIENTFRLENDFIKIHISVVSGGQTTVVTQLYNYEKMMFELNLTFTFCKVKVKLLVVKHNVGDFFVLSATF